MNKQAQRPKTLAVRCASAPKLALVSNHHTARATSGFISPASLPEFTLIEDSIATTLDNFVKRFSP